MRSVLDRFVRPLTALAVGAAVAWDALTWRAPLGLGAALAFMLALALVVFRFPRACADLPGAALALACLGASASLAVEPGPAGVALAAALLVIVASRGRRRGPLPLAGLAALAWFAPGAIAGAWRGVFAHRRRARSPAFPLRGWIAPAVIAAVFACIFAVGDPSFVAALRQLARLLGQWLVPDAAHARAWLVMLISAWGLLLFRMPAAWHAMVVRLDGLRQREAPGVTTAVVIRTLVLLHGVFLIENALGVRHAWLGVPLPAGTLAGGARHAAAALLLAALLSAALTLLAFARGSAVETDRTARALAVLWLAQVGLLLATAILRLERYVLAYSLTRARLAAIVCFALVAVGIALLAIRLMARRSNGWLLRATSMATLAVLLAVAFTNVNGIVARFNVRHCHEFGGGAARLDVAHLESLGPPALPAIEDALAALERSIVLGAPPSPLWRHLALARSSLRAQAAAAASDWRGLSVRSAVARLEQGGR